jgi:hypothetical protein
MGLVLDLQAQPHRFTAAHAIGRMGDQLGANLVVLYNRGWQSGLGRN